MVLIPRGNVCTSEHSKCPLNYKPQLPPSHVKLLVPKEGCEKRNPHSSGDNWPWPSGGSRAAVTPWYGMIFWDFSQYSPASSDGKLTSAIAVARDRLLTRNSRVMIWVTYHKKNTFSSKVNSERNIKWVTVTLRSTAATWIIAHFSGKC